MDQQFAALRPIFLEEAGEQLAILDAFTNLGVGDIDAAFRAAHALKGASATLGFDLVAQAAHAFEDELEALRQGLGKRSALTATLVTLTEQLRVAGSDERTHEFTLLIDATCPMPEVRAELALKALGAHGEIVSCIPPASNATTHIKIRLKTRQPWSTLESEVAKLAEVSLGQAPAVPAAPPEVERRATVRVPIERIDDIVRISGELYNERRRLINLADTLADLDEHRAIKDSAERIWRLVGSLQETSVRARLMPLQNVFKRLPRVALELGTQLRKEVKLSSKGGEIEIDRATLDGLADPLLHLIRNAIDHGIESAEERRANGKPTAGQITVSAEHRGQAVCVTISDDGQGIDPAKIRETVVAKGLLTREEAGALDDQQALDFIMTPGFSTAGVVTDVSGRGVGMDIVRSSIMTLGGRLEIDSQLGIGTSFQLLLPLSMAVLQCLIVRSGQSLWAIPTTNLVETALAGDFPNLASSLGLPADSNPKFAFTVAVPGSKPLSLTVQSLIGEEHLVAKPMSPLAGAHPAIQGAALMPDGMPILILDPLRL